MKRRIGLLLCAMCLFVVGCSNKTEAEIGVFQGPEIEPEIVLQSPIVIKPAILRVIGESSKYHKPECRYVISAEQAGKVTKKITYEVAKNLKLESCKVCNP